MYLLCVEVQEVSNSLLFLYRSSDGEIKKKTENFHGLAEPLFNAWAVSRPKERNVVQYGRQVGAREAQYQAVLKVAGAWTGHRLTLGSGRPGRPALVGGRRVAAARLHDEGGARWHVGRPAEGAPLCDPAGVEGC